MIKSNVTNLLGNDLICCGQFFVQREILRLNEKPTLGFGYAPLDGKRQFLVISLEKIQTRNKTKKGDAYGIMRALSIFHISGDGRSYRRGVLVPCVTSGTDFIISLVKDHLPDHERIDLMFSHGIQEEMKDFDLMQIQNEFVRLLGMDTVDSSQDFESRGIDLSAFHKMIESAVAAGMSKATTEIIHEVTKSQKAAVMGVTAWNSPKTVTTQETRAIYYGVSVQTIKRWEKSPFQGKPPDYCREASAEDLEKAGETYKSYKRGNKHSRENRKRKRTY